MRTEADKRARPWFPYFVLLVGLMLTLLGSYFASQLVQLDSRADFEADAQQVQSTVHTRLEAYIALLRGGAALAAVQTQMTREQFHVYVARLRIPENYPGIRGMGLSVVAKAHEREILIDWMHRQGDETFRIWPEDERDEYHAIIYLEPMDERNRAAIGYDMFTEPIRHEAMARARDQARPAASGIVTLVQEIDEAKQPGFLIYVPVYEGGTIPDTMEERREKLRAFSYSPFRAGDLFQAIFEGQTTPAVNIEIYDGAERDPEKLMFSTSWEHRMKKAMTQMEHELALPLEVAGRRWTVWVSAHPDAGRSWFIVPGVLVGGTMLSLMFFFFAYREAYARRAAERSAAQLRVSEQALREREERLRLIFESAEDYAIFSLDPQGRVASWNAGAERIFGYMQSEVLDHDAKLVFTPEDRERGEHERELDQARRTGMAHDDRWHVRKDGTRFFASGIVRPMRDNAGNLIGFIKVARDITDRMQAESNLRREKQFSDTLINSLPGIFYLFTAEGGFIRWNTDLERVTGYSGDDIDRMHWLEFFVGADQQVISGWLREVLAHGQSSAEAELVAKDMRRIPFFFTGRRIEVNGQSRVIGMGVDISERKRAEGALRAAQAELQKYAAELEKRVAERTANLEQSLQSLEGVLYHVAHDLRAPLRAMASFTNILIDDYAPKLDQQARDYISRITSAAQRMDELVQDLLAYGRLAHMAMPTNAVDLEAEVDTVLHQFAARIASRGAQVRVERPLPEVMANASVLNQVIANLLSNALKFVPAETVPQIRIHAESGAAIRLWIEDNGIGIKPEYQDRIFRVFERLHATDVYAGTGIGLAIVRKGVERMGGRVGVESKPGDGSKFWVELPAANESATASAVRE